MTDELHTSLEQALRAAMTGLELTMAEVACQPRHREGLDDIRRTLAADLGPIMALNRHLGEGGLDKGAVQLLATLFGYVALGLRRDGVRIIGLAVDHFRVTTSSSRTCRIGALQVEHAPTPSAEPVAVSLIAALLTELGAKGFPRGFSRASRGDGVGSFFDVNGPNGQVYRVFVEAADTGAASATASAQRGEPATGYTVHPIGSIESEEVPSVLGVLRRLVKHGPVS